MVMEGKLQDVELVTGVGLVYPELAEDAPEAGGSAGTAVLPTSLLVRLTLHTHPQPDLRQEPDQQLVDIVADDDRALDKLAVARCGQYSTLWKEKEFILFYTYLTMTDIHN